MTINFLLILGAGFFAWYLWGGLRCKEISRQVSANACRNAQVQFLDDSVALHKQGLARSTGGRLQLQREFIFEFTTDGSQRYQGRVYLSGNRVQRVDMDPYPI